MDYIHADSGYSTVILPRLRANLDVMPSPVSGRPGLFMRDTFRFSDASLIVPPMLMPGLGFFDGVHTEADMESAIARQTGQSDLGGLVKNLIEALSKAGFLEDDTYFHMREARKRAFEESAFREAAHSGSAYPDEIGSLKKVMRHYLDNGVSPHKDAIAVAAPHVSPSGGWQSYRAAYTSLPPDLSDRTFVILGTSHFGTPNKFGLTRKPFHTPYGATQTDSKLIDRLSLQPAVVMEDYAHAIEHSIEFQVLFLQAVYGPNIRILPILCGPFLQSIQTGGLPEDDEPVGRFLEELHVIAEDEGTNLFWILGVDMAHMGARYRDKFDATADRDQMEEVGRKDRARIECIIAGDRRGYWERVQENRDDLKWCGASPLYTFMKALPRARGMLRRYEQWNIDPKSVVSFAGLSFSNI